MNSSPPYRLPRVLILLGMITPTLITYVYFDLLSNADPMVQKVAYAIGKCSQCVVMLVSLWLWRKHVQRDLINAPERPSIASDASDSKRSRMLVAIGSGLLIGISILVGYQWLLSPLGIMDPVKPIAQAKLRSLGADSPWVLVWIGAFYAVFHSGFEELYWRGFVYRGLRESINSTPAICFSSLAFMAHHVIVLAKFFGYTAITTYLFALGVAIGGGIWAILYQRFGSLVPGWISHAIVDAAIFGVGFLLLFG